MAVDIQINGAGFNLQKIYRTLFSCGTGFKVSMALGVRMKFIGFDGCKAGWIFIALDENDSFEVGILSRFEFVRQYVGPATLILVDIPIGLLSSSSHERRCDAEARRLIKPRGSSVFPAPARSAIHKNCYQEGSQENYRCLGKKLSKQSWAISPKIREVDEFLLAEDRGGNIREMHPEVAFWALNGRRPMKYRKGEKGEKGFLERIEVLKRHLANAERIVAAARSKHPLKKDLADDDILDALVGAVTASHYPEIATIPENPTCDEHGIAMEMVYSTKD